jgi:hypothetical protein
MSFWREGEKRGTCIEGIWRCNGSIRGLRIDHDKSSEEQSI